VPVTSAEFVAWPKATPEEIAKSRPRVCIRIFVILASKSILINANLIA